MLYLEIVKQNEVEKAMHFVNQGKAHLKAQGINQWQDGYPDESCIQADINNQRGYFLMDAQEAVGYLCVDFEGEPAYKALDGVWKGNGAYGVIHRFAIGDEWRGRGLATVVLRLVEILCKKKSITIIRVDTDIKNYKMQHILHNNGFEYCGVIWLDNSEKFVYEKLLVV